VVSEADLLVKEERTALAGPHRLLERPRRRRTRARAVAVTAAGLMTSPAVTVGSETPLAEAARIMRERGVKRLPVVDEASRIVGIVSRSDLLAVFARGDEEIRREIVDEVIVGTLLLDPERFDVTVADGIVELAGQADHRTDAVLVERVAARVAGVVDVRSRLTYRVDDGDLPAPAPRRVGHPIRF
jgi:CBS domain-containing protein